MKWFEPIIFIVAVLLVLTPIVIHFVRKKNGKLKCDCGSYISECTGNCNSCKKINKIKNKKEIRTLTYVLRIQGIKCSMCKSHINSLIRNKFDVIKVKSSNIDNSIYIVSKKLLNVVELKEVIYQAGYEVKSVHLQ